LHRQPTISTFACLKQSSTAHSTPSWAHSCGPDCFLQGQEHWWVCYSPREVSGSKGELCKPKKWDQSKAHRRCLIH
jgi:hypothetical protein